MLQHVDFSQKKYRFLIPAMLARMEEHDHHQGLDGSKARGIIARLIALDMKLILLADISENFDITAIAVLEFERDQKGLIAFIQHLQSEKIPTFLGELEGIILSTLKPSLPELYKMVFSIDPKYVRILEKKYSAKPLSALMERELG